MASSWFPSRERATRQKGKKIQTLVFWKQKRNTSVRKRVEKFSQTDEGGGELVSLQGTYSHRWEEANLH